LERGSKEREYIDGIKSVVDPKVITIAVVVIYRREMKKQIKAFLDQYGIPS